MERGREREERGRKREGERCRVGREKDMTKYNTMCSQM